MNLGSLARVVGLLVIGGLASAPGRADEPPPVGAEDEAFFEAKIRPVLAEKCWSCHGDAKQTSDLRLDSRASALEGGVEGPAVVPGKPEESLLITAVRRREHLKMPPKEALPDEAVRDLEEWVRRGAPWPAGSVAADSRGEAARQHWAFQPVRRPDVPKVDDPSCVASPVDAFLLARLEREGLAFSPPADRRTLIRRLSFDLTGLPPAPEEVEAFVADEAPDAYERLVDRLLASPRYGERWGRHWLDVARYADTKGYVFQEERTYPFAYTYRDYVVAAFNEDKPYDRFLVEQIAADRLPDAKPGELAASGFLTVGRRFLNVQEDIIDDRIDVVTRGLMGLTVACARCHDHKFDPIPTEDYYSLYGVFASSVEPPDLPVIGEPSGPEAAAYANERDARKAEVVKYLEGRRADLQAELRSKAAAYLTAAFDLGFDPRSPKLDETARAASLRPGLVRWMAGKWKAQVDGGPPQDPFFAPWQAFASLPAEGFGPEASAAASRLAPAAPEGAAAGPGTPQGPDVARVIAGTPPDSMREVARRYGDLLAQAAKPETPADPAVQSARRVLESQDGPFVIAPGEVRRLMDRAERDQFKALERKVVELDVTHPGAPPRAMVMNDRPQPVEPRVFIRGNPGRPGEAVPRRFLKVLSDPERAPFADGSGRLDLARAVANPDNPLTARVMVNRVWMHHFGEGLVRTPGDFGLRGEPPSHPELLDYLAARFVEGGWSVKSLHRLILTSNAYRQASDTRPESAERDPQNALLSRQARRRLDFEAMRDSLLAAAGRLDGRMGGRPVSITAEPSPTRRTLYGFIDRQNLDGLFRTFDFASPDASAPRRSETTVPQQALFLMNSPFAAEQARHLASRLDAIPADRPEARVRHLYRLLFGRDAEPREDEGEFADLRQARRYGERRRDGIAKGTHDQVGRRRLADQDDRHRGQHGERRFDEDLGVEQHADRDEEQHREGVAQRDRLFGRLLAEVAFAQHHAGEEGAQREGHAEQFRRAVGDAQRDGIDGEAEKLAGPGVRRVVHQPGNDSPSDHQHHRHEDRYLGQGDQQGEGDAGCRHVAIARGDDGDRRQQHQGQHHRQILDHQPADRDAAAIGVDNVTILQGADQHDGAGDREREAEDEARLRRPAQRPGKPGAHQGCNGDLADSAGHGDACDGEQVLHGEVKADTEHQQDDADFRQLCRQSRIGSEARRIGADHDAGQQVANQGLNAQPLGDETEDEGEHQTRSNGGDERCLVLWHPGFSPRWGDLIPMWRETGKIAISLKGRAKRAENLGPEISSAKSWARYLGEGAR